jgi:hypothetical protein
MKSHNASRKFRKLSTLSGICLAAMVVTSAGETFARGETLAQEAAPAAGEEKSNVRYTRKSGKVRTKDTLDTKFKETKEAADKESKRKVEMMQGAEFAKKRTAVAQEIADTQIEQLKRLLKATDKTHADYPDLLFRLSTTSSRRRPTSRTRSAPSTRRSMPPRRPRTRPRPTSSRPNRPSSRPRPRRPPKTP